MQETILNKVDDQVCVKVPVTLEGIKAIKTLKKQDVNVTATAIYSKQQGFLAMEAGADYIAYFNRMENMGIDPDDVIASFAEMIGLTDITHRFLAQALRMQARLTALSLPVHRQQPWILPSLSLH